MTWSWLTIGYNFIRFVIPMFVSTMIFLANQEKRSHWIWRFLVATLLYTGLSMVVSNFGVYLKIDWFFFTFLIFFAFAAFALYGVARISLKEAFFYAMAAYLVQNLVDNTNVLVFLIAGSPDNLGAQWAIFLVPYLLIYPIYFIVFVSRFKNKYAGVLENTLFFGIVIVGLFTTYVLSMYASFKEADPSQSVRTYAILADALELLLMFNIFNSSYLQTENEMLERLLARQDDANSRNQQNYELLSIRIHDLRHQIKTLEETATNEATRKSLQDLEQETRIFNNSMKTGNRALDTILSEKSLYCSNNNITFSCMANGAELSFMSESDIFALFDNAIENAIEALKNVPEGNRTITINVKSTPMMLFIHIENYCADKVAFAEGLPQSSKKDAVYHGYGTKSIAYIAKKYHGIASFAQENNLFKVNVYFPLKEK
jgi:hypothetical protein